MIGASKLVFNQLLSASNAGALSSVLSFVDEFVKTSKDIISDGEKKKLACETQPPWSMTETEHNNLPIKK